MWENVRKLYKNNKLNTRPSTWNHKFELPDGSSSVPDIQDFIKYIIKKHETLTAFPAKHIHPYINRINNKLVFKMKDGYKLELQRPETPEIIY